MVNDIYSGRVVYSVATYRSILADNYKPRAIEIYDPLNAPFLNHYRSGTVPNIAPYCRYQNLLQTSCSQVSRLFWIRQLYPAAPHFSSVYLKFVAASSQNHEILPSVDRDKSQITLWELVFIIFGSAFTLGEYTSSSEHGWISEFCFLFPPSCTRDGSQFTLRMYVHQWPRFCPFFNWSILRYGMSSTFPLLSSSSGTSPCELKALVTMTVRRAFYLYRSLNQLQNSI